MYNRSVDKGSKSTIKPSIYDLASQIEEQQQAKVEAEQIMKAYRKVENLPGGTSGQANKKQDPSKNLTKKPESEYANKVKQTLKQLNANRKKVMQANKQVIKPVLNEKINGLGPAERHLVQTGCKKLFKLLAAKYSDQLKTGFTRTLSYSNACSSGHEEQIRKWKMQRLFSGWQYQVMLSKIQREKVKRESIQNEKKQVRLALDFNYFITIKKVFKSWRSQAKRAIKKRELELHENLQRQRQYEQTQKRRSQLQAHPVEARMAREARAPANSELHNKLKGFLDGLKQQIEGKNRLHTIKQQTNESHVVGSVTQNSGEQSLFNNPPAEQQAQNQSHNNQADNQQDLQQHKGPLSNQQLEKRRRQLEKKAKSRKEALDKLKRQKEQKKKQEQLERARIEKQVEEQQKRVRQQQYRRFIKQKKEEEQWQARQKDLTRQAVQFDRLRVMKFYGWLHWAHLKQLSQDKAQQLGQVMTDIVLRRNLQKFICQVIEVGEQKLQKLQNKANKIYERKLLRKCILELSANKNIEKLALRQYKARHQVHTINIFFRQWQQARNSVQLQNYEWQRPRMKRSQCLHAVSLMHKTMEALKMNRDQQIQNRKISEHKNKIKQKLQAIVEQKPTINYDDFL